MKCPFLEEVVVRYCKASLVKKMIPRPSLVQEDPCVGCPEKCATFQESAYLTLNAEYSKKRVKLEEKVDTVRGFSFHPKASYQPNHIWIMIDKDNQIKVGIDDFAAKLLGDFNQISPVAKGEELNEIRFAKGNRVFRLPVQSLGRVIKTNDEAFANPKIVHQDPFENGWLFIVENESITDTLTKLLHGDNAKKWLEKDFDNLKHAIQDECEITIADGGELVQDFRTRLSEELIDKLLEKFLTSRKEK